MRRRDRGPGPFPPPFAARARELRQLAVGAGVATLLLLITGPAVLPAAGSVLLEYRATSSGTGSGAFARFAAVNVTAGFGTCLSHLNTTLPFGNGSARASSSMAEPRGCPTRTLLTFLPSVRFSNGLPTPSGHVLDARLDLLGVGGSTGILRDVQLYLQRVGGTNPILTATHIVITRGAVVSSSTSAANVTGVGTVGIGLHERLSLRALVGTATFSLVLVTWLADGGVVRAVDQERIVLTLTY